MSDRDAANFLSWLLEDVNDVHAVIDTDRDRQLKEFAGKGFLKCTGADFGTAHYEITGKWLQIIA